MSVSERGPLVFRAVKCEAAPLVKLILVLAAELYNYAVCHFCGQLCSCCQ